MYNYTPGLMRFNPDTDLIAADWPAPAAIRAYTTTRNGGVSEGPYSSLNLADHVADQPEHVEENRRIVCDALGIRQPVWLSQVHGVVVADAATAVHHAAADAIKTNQKQTCCAVLTADCLPLLFCNQQGTVVAAAHAGWRGLAAGVIEATVNAMQQNNQDLLVWLGPAIGPDSFEVGQEVYDAFVTRQAEAASAFVQTDATHFLADLYQLARIRLKAIGVEKVYGGGFCTVADSQRFYSFRRDQTTGRMASMIWIEA